jgi:glycosyltransferase involved in cell wall biosynthesis
VNRKNLKVLLTTPDFPPKLGGLSTFSINIKKKIEGLGIEVEIFHWNSISEIKQKSISYEKKSSEYCAIINIHYHGGYFLRKVNCKHINFYHGSEILYYSSNPIKHIIKKILKRKMNIYIAQSYLNLFISKFTKNKLRDLGLPLDYSRDIILSNSIEINEKTKISINNLNEGSLEFVCIARDVPHKNLSGCIDFCEKIAKISKRKVNLYLTTSRDVCSEKINITAIPDITDEKRESLYQKSHFNLLLSLDNSKKGFYEGFGLTVLEAGKYGTPSIVIPSGGLSESVHDSDTGWHITEVSNQSVTNLLEKISVDEYNKISLRCYDHTHQSHSLETYNIFFEKVFRDL